MNATWDILRTARELEITPAEVLLLVERHDLHLHQPGALLFHAHSVRIWRSRLGEGMGGGRYIREYLRFRIRGGA